MLNLLSAKRAKELAERRKKQNKCVRCGLLYFKTLEKCPHCSGLSDDKVKQLMKQRGEERSSLGRFMLLGMLVIIFLMYLFNT